MEDEGQASAAQAFEVRRSEMSLVCRAVERLTAERTEVADQSDYSETLEVISHNRVATAQRIDALGNNPAPSISPEELSRQIDVADYTTRKEDHRLFVAATQRVEAVAKKTSHQLHSHAEAGEQRRRLWRTGLIALIVGALLWAILAGPIARAMPVSWLWPERMAARTLRMPMWQGGQRLMQARSPQSFAGLRAADRLVVFNRDVLDVCRKQATKANKAVCCEIRVSAGD